MAHGLVVDKGGGVVDAVAVAQLVELLLVDEGVQQLPVDVGGDDVFGQLVLAVGSQLHIAVSAAQQDDLLVGELGGHGGGVAAEGVGALVVGAHPVVDDGTVMAGEGGVLAVGDALYPIGLVKGSCYAVYIDVAAKEQRLKGQVVHDGTLLQIQ